MGYGRYVRPIGRTWILGQGYTRAWLALRFRRLQTRRAELLHNWLWHHERRHDPRTRKGFEPHPSQEPWHCSCQTDELRSQREKYRQESGDPSKSPSKVGREASFISIPWWRVSVRRRPNRLHVTIHRYGEWKDAHELKFYAWWNNTSQDMWMAYCYGASLRKG